MFSFKEIMLLALLNNGLTFQPVYSQLTHIQSCGLTNNIETDCLIRHVSDKAEQLSAKSDMLSRQILDKIYAIAPTDYHIDITADDSLTDTSLPENCQNILSLGYTDSGVYTIYEPVSTVQSSQFRTSIRRAINVYCDMEDLYGGPGWIVFQRRQDGSVSFNRNWNEYKDGFGDLEGNVWIGNDNLALITGGATTYELRIELQAWDNERRYAKYGSFVVENACSDYKLRVGSFLAGDAGDSMTNVDGYPFSTPDNDNDAWSRHCARERYMAGFWYRSCAHATLNNPYHNTSSASSQQGIVWYHWHGYLYSIIC